MVKLIQACTTNSKCRIRYNQQMSEEFSVENGLRQSDVLSLIETIQKETSQPTETTMEWPCTSRPKDNRSWESGRDGKG